MDPFTAALILSVIVAGVSAYSANESNNGQIANQNKLAQQQEQARQDQVRAEVGLAKQRTQTALTGAATRGTSSAPSSFASSASILGSMPSVNGNASEAPTKAGSSGTF